MLLFQEQLGTLWANPAYGWPSCSRLPCAFFPWSPTASCCFSCVQPSTTRCQRLAKDLFYWVFQPHDAQTLSRVLFTSRWCSKWDKPRSHLHRRRDARAYAAPAPVARATPSPTPRATETWWRRDASCAVPQWPAGLRVCSTWVAPPQALVQWAARPGTAPRGGCRVPKLLA